MKAKEILKIIGEGLLLAVMIGVFGCLVSVLGTGAVVLIGLIDEWVGIGYKVFVYVVWFVAFSKAWDALNWVVDKIVERAKRREINN